MWYWVIGTVVYVVIMVSLIKWLWPNTEIGVIDTP